MKKHSWSYVIMALVLALVMAISPVTAMASEVSNGSDVSITATGGQTTKKAFNPAVGKTFYVSTTYIEPVIYIAVTDNYESSNTYKVTITDPNDNSKTFYIKGNGNETRTAYFSMQGQYTFSFTLYNGQTNGANVTASVRMYYE